MSRYFILPVAFLGVFLLALSPNTANALDGYSSSEEAQFMDWCTGAKSASESTCSCTLKKVAQTVPAATLVSYISSASSGQSLSLTSLATTSATMTATTVVQSLATCGG